MRPVDFVLHPTDLSEASERAFHHALAVSVRLGAQFTLLHAVGRRATDDWSQFPSVRSKLGQWKAAGTMDGLGDRHRQASISKIEVDIRDPVAASLQYIDRNGVDLIVLATTGRRGLARLVRAPRAELLARKSKLMTLFVPDGARVFVDGATGEVTLKRILIPVDPATDPRPAMVRAVNAGPLTQVAVVGGDFNAWAGNESALQLMRDAFPESPPWDNLGTRGSFPTDHIFFRSAAYTQFKLERYVRIGETYGSDHNGRRATLRDRSSR